MKVATKIALVAGLLCLTAPRSSAQPADEPEPIHEMPTLHMRLGTGDGTLRGPNGLDYRIPQGSHILAPDAWKAQDDEFIVVQDRVTRLEAENKSFRESADDWHPNWTLVVIGAAAGIVLGTYIGARL